jgi:hypothetical protein
MTAVVRANLRAPWAALAGMLAATMADVVFDPAHRHVPLCPFHALTGWDCPLCGGLRAADALVHGRPVTALHDNVLLLVALPLAAGFWALWLRRSLARRPAPVLGRAAMVAVVAVLVAFTVVRNLPGLAALRP